MSPTPERAKRGTSSRFWVCVAMAFVLAGSIDVPSNAEPESEGPTDGGAPRAGLPLGYPISRVEVDTGRHPWKAVGRINVAGHRHCTGTLVSENVVVTAAHCVWNSRTRTWYPNEYIHFVAGYQRDTYPAHARASKIVASKDFVGGRPPEPATFVFDWALVELDEPVGRTVGHLGWAKLDAAALERLGPDRQRFAQAGYRRDRRHVLSVDEACRLEKFIEAGKLLFHRCATIEGDSGGPLLLHLDGDWMLVGINVGLYRESPRSMTHAYAVPSANFMPALVDAGLGGGALPHSGGLWGSSARPR